MKLLTILGFLHVVSSYRLLNYCWNDNSDPLVFVLDTSGLSINQATTYTSIIEDIFENYNNIPFQDMKLELTFGDINLSPLQGSIDPSPVKDGINSITFGRIADKVPAVSKTRPDFNSGTLEEVDVVADISWGPSDETVYNLFLHEFGHVLCLDHSQYKDSVMLTGLLYKPDTQTYVSDLSRHILTQDDILGLFSAYSLRNEVSTTELTKMEIELKKYIPNSKHENNIFIIPGSSKAFDELNISDMEVKMGDNNFETLDIVPKDSDNTDYQKILEIMNEILEKLDNIQSDTQTTGKKKKKKQSQNDILVVEPILPQTVPTQTVPNTFLPDWLISRKTELGGSDNNQHSFHFGDITDSEFNIDLDNP
jgi:hypothetical protein